MYDLLFFSRNVLQSLCSDVIWLNRSKRVVILLFFCFVFLSSKAQTLPETDPVLSGYLRVLQLENKVDSTISMTVRPVQLPFIFSGLSLDSTALPYFSGELTWDPRQFQILPINVIQQINSDHPYGWNDGAMIGAKGYQAKLSIGVFTRLGPLSIQFRPEIIYASNPDFRKGGDAAAFDFYTDYISTADMPGYSWNRNYSYLDYGQSSIRMTFDPVSLGLSNESLWWGPGRHNALVMSNTARGFRHLTFNTTQPVRTPLGSLEGQIIAGRLDNSEDIRNLSRRDEWRYLSGMVFSYQPRWVPGLFVGLTRVFQMYHSDVQGTGDYFPLLQAFEKNKTNEGSKLRDQLTSVFSRLLLPEAGAEIYLEYARNDHSVDIRDFIMEPEHSRAYTAGFQKLVPLNMSGERLLLGAEVTQLSQAPTRQVRDAGTFYTHSQILQGYTHRGEVLGAGVGPGGNIQTLDVSWLNGYNKVGFQLQRYVHNNDYYQVISAGSSGLNGQWVDLSVGMLIDHNYKNLLISGKVLGIQSYNYLWQSGYFGLPKKDVFNLHMNVGLSYHFD